MCGEKAIMLEAPHFSRLKWRGRISKGRKENRKVDTLLSGGPEGRYITVVI